MIRLTLILAVLIVVAMIVLPPDANGPGDAPTASAPDRPPRVDLSDDALVETEDGGLVLITAEGEELPIDRVIEPSALTEADAEVNLAPAETSGGVAPLVTEDAEDAPQDTETAEAPAAPGATDGTRLRVTGDRVNFRAGPSTGDEILAALTLGTEVEVIERVADGWVHLRVPDTGLTGYMSEDFLEPAD
ncbi:MAG: Bacterial SH3 domain [Rhodobacteraceae bacterium HLUCCO18]|nr:MAG: Bacterial SH3 domain [Rhodobacteraceae bacterium HLUCCO18]